MKMRKTNFQDWRFRAQWKTAQWWRPFLETQANSSSQGGVVGSCCERERLHFSAAAVAGASEEWMECYRAGHLPSLLENLTSDMLRNRRCPGGASVTNRICFWGKGYELPDFSWPGSLPHLFCTPGEASCSHVYLQLGRGREKVLTLRD